MAAKLELAFGLTFSDLFKIDTLARLDALFLTRFDAYSPALKEQLLQYRKDKTVFSPEQQSELLIEAATVLEPLLIELFHIQDAAKALQIETLSHQPVFAFKKWFVQRRAKRRLNKEETLPSFAELTSWLHAQVGTSEDMELAIARLSVDYLKDEETHSDVIETLTQWCIQAIKTPEGQAYVKGWVSFHFPNRTDYQHLIPIIPVQDDRFHRIGVEPSTYKLRDGFKLTDRRMDARKVQSEIDYCVYCHDHDGDFCSKGFPEKKAEPELGLKKNPLGVTLTGCPLEEKISEMHSLKRDGLGVAALAMVMVDNPMCPATGHRICNDCMRACIYQKQDAVDIPQIETRVLTDVLHLPWGVEIYDLLTRWNPLRDKQYIAKPYNNLKVLIAGLGPAGYTLAHHLTLEGFAVVGIEGLKIEPLPEIYLKEPIYAYDDILEELDNRVMAGFGGVAEYGITVRWDKNFLKLIYLSLMRRSLFQAFGGVRFGGSLTVDDAWALGFDHVAIAVGAGLSKALPIPGSLAKGMRQANDFLMALQLTGAAKENSLTNLQLRMPMVVIGGGLTGVDTATEAQAYYIKQVEKVLARYETLTNEYGEEKIRADYDEEGLIILDEFLNHGRAIREERERAKNLGGQPNFIKLLQAWGGVTIVYRRCMEESPAYIANYEELHKALEEGVYYLSGLQPIAVGLDNFNHCAELICQKRAEDEHGKWHNVDDPVILPAKTILSATGATPNVAYTFEHKGVFERDGLQYKAYAEVENEFIPMTEAEHVKDPNFGPFTSYNHEGKRVSFLGDTHPVFNGNVVKAIASAQKIYPKIVESLSEKIKEGDVNALHGFQQKLQEGFTSSIAQIERKSARLLELTIKAPLIAKKHKPGNFYRIQNFETQALKIHNTALQTEALALTAMAADKEQGLLRFMVIEQGVSSRICSTFKEGMPISIMGPTGVRTRVEPETEKQETVLIMGGLLSLVYIRALGPALKAGGIRVIYLGHFHDNRDVYCQNEIESCADLILWSTTGQAPLPSNRPQDYSVIASSATNALITYAEDKTHAHAIPLDEIDRVILIGNTDLLREFHNARKTVLHHHLLGAQKVTGSVYSSMQCMLKGVCSQCLQWQIDPRTGERTKAVFACSWQDQPLELIDIDNIDERLSQNAVQETLSSQWLDWLLASVNHS